VFQHELQRRLVGLVHEVASGVHLDPNARRHDINGSPRLSVTLDRSYGMPRQAPNPPKLAMGCQPTRPLTALRSRPGLSGEPETTAPNASRMWILARSREYGTANGLPGLGSGTLESRLSRLRRIRREDAVVLWTTSDRWPAEPG
jgi:hypothetical protein